MRALLALRDAIAVDLGGSDESRAQAESRVRCLLFRALLPAGAPGTGLPAPAREQWGAFQRGWRWSLRPGPGDAGPDLLGAFTEACADRKGSGVFFTARDVADYLCRATLIPALFPDPFDLNPVTRAAGIDRYVPPSVASLELLPCETEWEREYRLGRLDWLQEQRPSTFDEALTLNLDLPRLALHWIVSAEKGAVATLWERLLGFRVLDPTCGAGAFLLAALRVLLPLRRACAERLGIRDPHAAAAIVSGSLFGTDLSIGAVEACRLRLLLELLALPGAPPVSELPDLTRNVVVADALEPLCGAGFPACAPSDPEVAFDKKIREPSADSTETSHHQPQTASILQRAQAGEPAPRGFSAVVGNPPFVSRGTRELPADLATASCPNLYAAVVERGLRSLAPGGRLGMVLPISAVSVAEYAPLAERALRGAAWISTYSNRPARLFPEVEQRLCLLVAAPDAPPAVHVSPYQHWYASERPRLFERLDYFPADRWETTGMPVKTGCPLAAGIWRKLAAQRGRLRDLLGGTDAVWVHDGPTYWVRAFPFPPLVAGTGGGSSHYHRVPVSGRERARVVAAILSSTTFYFFFKMVSNCRDLGPGQWARFPLNALAPAAEAELAQLGAELESQLHATAVRKRRVYPSGPVEFEDYSPAAAKDVIDRIDAVLAGHYGFTPAERDYLRHYDVKYRMGHHDG